MKVKLRELFSLLQNCAVLYYYYFNRTAMNQDVAFNENAVHSGAIWFASS